MYDIRMKVAVLGYGKEGVAAVDYWREGNDVTVCDQNPSVVLPDHIDGQTGDDYLQGLDRFDLIVRSPQIHPRDIVSNNSPAILSKVTTGTQEFMKNCPAPIIGVTGTKGKGTTSSLITHILKAAGYKVHLGGNIGVAPLEMNNWGIEASDWVVLELSNFQLIDCQRSPKIAVCVMTVPEHLDWHTDTPEYIRSKQNLFLHQTAEDLAVYNRNNNLSTEIAAVSPAFKLSYEVPEAGAEPTETDGAYVLGEDIYMDQVRVCGVADVRLLGRHNLQNICAAITATWDVVGQNVEAITAAIRSFDGLPHRIEPVREVNDVWYYNDSFSSAGGATIAAIDAIPQPKVLIVGGYDRGLDYRELAKHIADHSEEIRSVLLIGQTGPKLKELLDNVDYTNYKLEPAKDMQTIVETARQLAQPGDAVVLSPGFASFDMFKNFEDRGLQFKARVDAL